MKCLLVEDEPGIREGMATLLRLRGHEVRTAADAATALRQLAEQPFDVVVTDWRLPDGRARPLLERAGCPVVVVSGHPEEVAPEAAAVLGKPILPDRLLALLAEVAGPVDSAAEAAARAPAADGLPCDVREVLDRAVLLLEPGAVRVVDDGTFVTLTAPWPGDHLLPEFLPLGGDLRILAPGGRPTLELRWCRDGRPDPQLPVVPAGAPWPDAAEFCVDYDAVAAGVERLCGDLERASRRRALGCIVHFLNVRPALRCAVADSGRGGGLPMKEPIGPRLPAVLGELWS